MMRCWRLTPLCPRDGCPEGLAREEGAGSRLSALGAEPVGRGRRVRGRGHRGRGLRPAAEPSARTSPSRVKGSDLLPQGRAPQARPGRSAACEEPAARQQVSGGRASERSSVCVRSRPRRRRPRLSPAGVGCPREPGPAARRPDARIRMASHSQGARRSVTWSLRLRRTLRTRHSEEPSLGALSLSACPRKHASGCLHPPPTTALTHQLHLGSPGGPSRPEATLQAARRPAVWEGNPGTFRLEGRPTSGRGACTRRAVWRPPRTAETTCAARAPSDSRPGRRGPPHRRPPPGRRSRGTHAVPRDSGVAGLPRLPRQL